MRLFILALLLSLSLPAPLLAEEAPPAEAKPLSNQASSDSLNAGPKARAQKLKELFSKASASFPASEEMFEGFPFSDFFSPDKEAALRLHQAVRKALKELDHKPSYRRFLSNQDLIIQAFENQSAELVYEAAEQLRGESKERLLSFLKARIVKRGEASKDIFMLIEEAAYNENLNPEFSDAAFFAGRNLVLRFKLIEIEETLSAGALAGAGRFLKALAPLGYIPIAWHLLDPSSPLTDFIIDKPFLAPALFAGGIISYHIGKQLKSSADEKQSRRESLEALTSETACLMAFK